MISVVVCDTLPAKEAFGSGGELMSNSFFYERHDFAVRVQSGRNMSFYAHLHRQAEIYLQLEGVQQMMIDGKTRVMQPGDAALVLPNRVHSYQAQEDEAHVLAIVDLSSAGEYAQILLSSSCDEPFLPAGRVHPDVKRCFEALRQDVEPDSALSRAYISVVLGRMTGALDLKPASSVPGRDAAKDLLLYIAEHIAEPLSLDMLSKNLFINKYSISRIFSEQIGCSLHTYINALRVELARNLLREPLTDTAQLIARCGFESERTFYRTFKEHCGMTPGQYRRWMEKER